MKLTPVLDSLLPHPPLPISQGKEISSDKDYSKQKMVLGTHTSDGEQNYLMVAEVRGGGYDMCGENIDQSVAFGVHNMQQAQ